MQCTYRRTEIGSCGGRNGINRMEEPRNGFSLRPTTQHSYLVCDKPAMGSIHGSLVLLDVAAIMSESQ